MSMLKSGSGSFKFNKADLVFVLKLAGLSAAVGGIASVISNADVIKNMVDPTYAPLVTGIVIPLLVFLQQFVSDNHEKVKKEREKPTDPPLPPMVLWLLIGTLLIPGVVHAQIKMYSGYSDQESLTFKPYSLIRLECQEEGKSYVWILRRLPDGFRPDAIRLDTGKELVWTGPPGDYDVDTIYTDKEGTLQQVFTRVIIEGGAPLPPVPVPPGPTPPGPTPPSPTPPKPDGKIVPLPKPTGDKFGFSGISYDLAMAVPEKDRLLAEKIADNYGSISAAIFAGGIVDVSTAFNELRTKNQELGNDPAMPAWKTWFEKLGFQVNTDWGNRKFTTRSDIAEVFREVQVGLLASIGKKPE